MNPNLTFKDVRDGYTMQKHAERWQDKPKEPERPPGPLKLAMLREPTAEELRIAELDRKAEAQRRVCKPVAEPLPKAPEPAAAPRPKPFKKLLVELCKCKHTYWLEYHKEAQGAPWVLVDAPEQLAPLASLPVDAHGPWLERMCYTVVGREVK